MDPVGGSNSPKPPGDGIDGDKSGKSDESAPSKQPISETKSIQPEKPVPTVHAVGTDSANRTKTEQPRIHEPERNKDLNPEPKDPNSGRMTFLTAVIAIATIVNVGVFYYESEDTSTKVGTLSNKAGEIVTSMNTALSDNRDAISKAFSANKDAVDASNIQNQRSVNATLKAAAEANKIAQKSLEIQERPWVGATSINIGADIAVGQTLTATMSVQNSGRSPAIHVQTDFRMNTVCGAFPRRPDYGTISEHSRSILMPGAPPSQTSEVMAPGPMTTADMDILTRNDCNMYGFAIITYDDTFGRSHWRHVCSVWQKHTPRVMVTCGFYTDGDEDYPDGKEPN